MHLRPRDEGQGFIAIIARKGKRDHYAAGKGSTREKAVYAASGACYKLASLDAMDAQGWTDANTGQTGIPLDSHHIQKRSKGRLDAAANLAGVSRRTHDGFHGQVEFSKK